MPGGVCAVLDYDVELMADYVSEMSTRVVLPDKPVNSAFRKYISRVLTSTRLPSTTILLGMNYLAKRINVMRSVGKLEQFDEGKFWRMVTTALMLGSKFLDDNTFQNKSWSEVSGIPVTELNELELDWLKAIGWRLYVNLDESNDYTAWLANWKEWLENKKRQQAQANRERLAAMVPPIDTDLVRPRNPSQYSAWHQQQVAEYERLSNMKRNQTTPASLYRREPSEWNYIPWHSMPPTPPDSGYGTPECIDSPASMSPYYSEWPGSAAANNLNGQLSYRRTSSYYGFQSTGPARNHTGPTTLYNPIHNIWEPPSATDCNCANCTSVHGKTVPYFVAHGYGQPVVG